MKRQITVLALDDEPSFALLVTNILRDHGYGVLTAHSSAEAERLLDVSCYSSPT